MFVQHCDSISFARVICISLVECVVCAATFLWYNTAYNVDQLRSRSVLSSPSVVTVESHEDTLVKRDYGWQGIPRIYATR